METKIVCFCDLLGAAVTKQHAFRLASLGSALDENTKRGDNNKCYSLDISGSALGENTKRGGKNNCFNKLLDFYKCTSRVEYATGLMASLACALPGKNCQGVTCFVQSNSFFSR